MPVEINTYLEVDSEVREKVDGTHTKEAAVLKAIHNAGTPASRDVIDEKVSFDGDSLSSTFYRLRRKELIEKTDDGFVFTNDDVARLAESFIIESELLV